MNKTKTLPICDAPLDGQNFKQDGKARAFAIVDPSAGWVYAPQMGDSCKTNSPAVHCQNGGRKGVPRGKALASFLSPFLCDEAKKWHLCRYTERAKLCEAVGEVVGNLELPHPLFILPPHFLKKKIIFQEKKYFPRLLRILCNEFGRKSCRTEVF